MSSLVLFRHPFASLAPYCPRGRSSDPFYYTERLWRDMDRALGFREDGSRTRDQFWTPSCDLTETDEHFIFKADLPGAKKEDVKVEIQQGVLNITASREDKHETEDAHYHHIERSTGTFHRAFTLPSDVDPSQITASMNDGVLELQIPKPKAEEPKAIQVSIA